MAMKRELIKMAKDFADDLDRVEAYMKDKEAGWTEGEKYAFSVERRKTSLKYEAVCSVLREVYSTEL